MNEVDGADNMHFAFRYFHRRAIEYTIVRATTVIRDLVFFRCLFSPRAMDYLYDYLQDGRRNNSKELFTRITFAQCSVTSDIHGLAWGLFLRECAPAMCANAASVCITVDSPVCASGLVATLVESKAPPCSEMIIGIYGSNVALDYQPTTSSNKTLRDAVDAHAYEVQVISSSFTAMETDATILPPWCLPDQFKYTGLDVPNCNGEHSRVSPPCPEFTRPAIDGQPLTPLTHNNYHSNFFVCPASMQAFVNYVICTQNIDIRCVAIHPESASGFAHLMHSKMSAMIASHTSNPNTSLNINHIILADGYEHTKQVLCRWLKTAAQIKGYREILHVTLVDTPLSFSVRFRIDQTDAYQTESAD